MATRVVDASAVESALGYIYQCRLALLLALGEVAERPELYISVERFDDVSFEYDGTPMEMIQTKHHLGRSGTLTDMSVDLWKTLGIWSRRVEDESLTHLQTRFLLITTAEAPQGSASSLLRVRDRDVENAHRALVKAAIESTNKDTANARSDFLRLDEDRQKALLASVNIIDSHQSVLQIVEELRRAVKMVVPRVRVDHFLERLEGWWYKVIVEALSRGAEAIPLTALDAKLDSLRAQFAAPGSLPLDYETVVPPTGIADQYDERLFVQQLRLIGVKVPRISIAKTHYYRASTQRSRWMREKVIYSLDLVEYERLLREAWEPRFLTAQEDLGDESSPNQKIDAGRRVYQWVEQEADIPLLETRSPSICRGSFHILSDQKKLGWHPDFETGTKSPVDFGEG